ncbi:MAG: FadR/GntR family transcriptional regulator [Nostocoides sp.]
MVPRTRDAGPWARAGRLTLPRLAGPTQPAVPGIWELALGPLDDTSRPAAAARRLRQSIEIGLLPHGARLPPESELAAQLGVSLVTLRSALAILREQRLIETRRGRTGGNFVVLPDNPDHRLLEQKLMRLDIDAIRDRRDYHMAIAGKAAELAAERARGGVLTRLQDAAAAIAEAETSTAAIHLDSRFHLQLAASTRSAMLTRAELAVQNELAPLLWIPGLECQTVDEARAAHQVITDAIAGRDRSTARAAAEQHVASTLNQLIAERMHLSEDA